MTSDIFRTFNMLFHGFCAMVILFLLKPLLQDEIIRGITFHNFVIVYGMHAVYFTLPVLISYMLTRHFGRHKSDFLLLPMGMCTGLLLVYGYQHLFPHTVFTPALRSGSTVPALSVLLMGIAYLAEIYLEKLNKLRRDHPRQPL